ncbi:hypothetical protein ACQEVB_33820 [Pseudonocardia sp. CA-107938]
MIDDQDRGPSAVSPRRVLDEDGRADRGCVDQVEAHLRLRNPVTFPHPVP